MRTGNALNINHTPLGIHYATVNKIACTTGKKLINQDPTSDCPQTAWDFKRIELPLQIIYIRLFIPLQIYTIKEEGAMC